MGQGIELAIFFTENNQLQSMISTLNENEEARFFNIRFQDLFLEVEGDPVIKALLSNFLKKNGRDFQRICEYFKQSFPAYFSENDHLISTAEYYLEIATKLEPGPNSKKERQQYILDAVNILSRCVSVLTKENLEKIFQYLREQKFFLEIIKLLIKKMINLDMVIQKMSRSTNSNFEQDGQVGSIQNELNSVLQYCRENIMSLLQQLHHTITYYKNAHNDKKDIFYGLTLEECNSLKDRIIEEISHHPDVYLHVTLIRWLFSAELFKEILCINSEFIEVALDAEGDGNFLTKSKLLYKYYTNSQKFMNAYNIALKIAIYDQGDLRPDTDDSNPEFKIPEKDVIPIKDRIMYLNYASQSLNKLLEINGIFLRICLIKHILIPSNKTEKNF